MQAIPVFFILRNMRSGKGKGNPVLLAAEMEIQHNVGMGHQTNVAM